MNSTNVTLFGNGGDNSLVSSGGSDVTLFGGDGSDSLSSSGGTNVTLFGGSGGDDPVNPDGNDTLTAGGGSDVTLFGGSGDDSLGDIGIDFELRCLLGNIEQSFAARNDLYMEVMRKFREAGIRIPTPPHEARVPGAAPAAKEA